ncbi:hypothetical protein Cylst_4759 [Cylindrospermum stagnale PCC 7417]|uniref:Uncharacterized protein n=1 Tax=Cylindrospermum stagnale PCC 7417 TaxID=56107 RepID=K9X2E6_9NOST|nr:hypothetical protein [Cylindrospermum stagnale]AFZ26820.1 hypothetical protein Cylst_4759 [Cylindrospermum stagnale PCC 7417]
MSRLLYENSVSYKGYLIIPFVFGTADNHEIYSYKLLAEIGHKSQFHKADNPAKVYGSSINNIVDIAKEHIEQHSDFVSQGDSFKSRYVYRHNLIIVFQEGGKYFYDHYPPELLNNIAAPKLFTSEYECLNWIQQGLLGRHIKQKAK